MEETTGRREVLVAAVLSKIEELSIEHKVPARQISKLFAKNVAYENGWEIINPTITRTPRYYIVGATWGTTDMYDRFVHHGYWQMGYSDEEAPNFMERRESMRPNDYIAIKKIIGPRDCTKMIIRAIGKIKTVVDGIVMVDWISRDRNLEINHKGCIGTIYGPFKKNEQKEYYQWLNEIFSL